MVRVQVLVLAAAVALAAGGVAQAATKPKPVPPSLAGMWVIDSAKTQKLDAATTPLSDKARAFLAENRARNLKGALQAENHVRCLPHGMPDLMTTPMAIKVLDAPGQVVMLAEISSLPRTIYLDQPRPDDIEPSWNGYSAGRWEGSTLVVDTTDFNDRVAYILGIGLIVRRTPKLKLHERLWLTDGGATLMDEMTVDQPPELTTPVKVTYAYRRLPEGSRLMEYVCEPSAAIIEAYEAQYGPEKPFQ